MPSDKFKRRMNREIRLALREMRDGCPDCIALGGGKYCPVHHNEAIDLIISPRKKLTVKVPKKGS